MPDIEILPPGNVTQIDEVNMHCLKQDKAFHTKYYPSTEERKTLIKDEGDAACMLYEYYLRMASIGDQPIEDKDAAEYFGWNIHKAKQNRLRLQRAGWFRAVKYTLSDGRKGVSYYIGQNAVAESQPKK